MEFKFRDGENRSIPTLSPQQRPLSIVPLVSGHPLRGGFPSPGGFSCSGGFPSIIPSSPSPRVYPINAEEAIRRDMVREQVRRELEKEEIRREILAREMAWRRELEEEVRRELASERALRMPMHRMEEVTFGERVFSLSMNPGMRLNNPDHNNNIYSGPQPQLAPKVDITQFKKQIPDETNQDKIIKLAKPNADLLSLKCKEVLDVNHGGAKRKLVTPCPGDNNHAGSSLQKKPKKEWSCALCQIVATSEKGLNDHLQGKKHKVKEASLTTKQMGLDARQDGETLGSGISPADKDKGKGKVELSALCQIVATSEKGLNDHLQGKSHNVKAASLKTQKMGLDARQDGETLGSGISSVDKGKDKVELIKMDLAVQKSHDSGGIDTENEATIEKEVLKTKALTTRKKFKFYCAFCQVRTHSEVVMESHKSGKRHLANITKLNPNNSAGACAAANSE